MTGSAEPAAPVVVVFAPFSMVTVAVKIVDTGAEVDFQPGGQGVQVARVAGALGADPVLCTACGGEPGRVFRLLLAGEPGTARWVSGGVTQVDLHVRRDGRRHDLVKTSPVPLDRHSTDVLYRTTLTAASRAAACVLTDGPAGSEAYPEVYRRLADDLGGLGVPVIADLTGEALGEALAGRAAMVRVSDLDLLAEGRIADLSRQAVVEAMHALQDAGAGYVVVARDDGTTLALTDVALFEVDGPELHSPRRRAVGDSMTASLAVSLAIGEPFDLALRHAYAVGAMDVIGAGPGSSVEALAGSATVRSAPAS